MKASFRRSVSMACFSRLVLRPPASVNFNSDASARSFRREMRAAGIHSRPLDLNYWLSGGDAVDASAALDLLTFDAEPELLLERAGHDTPDRMRLPADGLD